MLEFVHKLKGGLEDSIKLPHIRTSLLNKLSTSSGEEYDKNVQNLLKITKSAAQNQF